MLVCTSGMKLWWCLRHFSQESWKSSAQVHKLMEKNDFSLKIFSFEHLFWTKRVQLYLTFRTFWTEARKSLAQSQKLIGKTFLVGKFFSIKGFCNGRRQFRQQSHYFFVKNLRSYCSQSKNKENDKYSNKFFFWNRMIWTIWIQIGQPYRKVLCNKPAPIIA